jgi:ElaB/YqjD/DUF883 family membrane-anchored ribosome-binding protein
LLSGGLRDASIFNLQEQGEMMNNDVNDTNRNIDQSTDLNSRELLAADLRRVADDAGALLNEYKSLTADEAAAALRRIKARLNEANAKIDRARVAVMRQTRDAARKTQTYARENPWTIVAAIAATVVIAILVGNRAVSREQDPGERH